MKIKLAIVFTMVLLASATSGYALPVDVVNYSFETNIQGVVLLDGQAATVDFQGWTESSGYAGAYNPGGSTGGLDQAPDGEIVAYMANDGSVTLQDLSSYSLREGATLTLQVDVGWWWGSDAPNFDIAIVSDGVWLASTSDISGLTPGTFGTVTLQYEVTDPGLNEENVAIVIAKDGGGLMFFDNVRLSNDGPTSVPEPTTLLLLGAGMFSISMARSVKKLLGR